MKLKVTRRKFLAAAGGSALALPFLRALPGYGQTATKRFLILAFSGNGVVRHNWGAEKLGPERGNITLHQSFKAALDPYKDYITIVNGLRNKSADDIGGTHEGGMESLWSGGKGPSIDQIVGQRVVVAEQRRQVGAERHAGRFPRTLETALGVPGVGLYTASAVLSIAYGLPLPVVDGNVRRVLARLLALRGPAFRKDGPYYNRAEDLLDPKRPGDWNQALMELGATICLPRKPACPACPLRQRCEARARGLVEELPESRARRAPVDVTVAAALVERDGRVLLVRRPEELAFTENHPSWTHMYLMMMVAQIGFALAYVF